MSERYQRKLQGLFNQVQEKSHWLLTGTKAPLIDPIFTQQGKEDLGRIFSNAIHDMPAVWSGCASSVAIKNKLRNQKYKPSKDHYNSRQRCGEEIVTLIIRSFGKKCAPTLEEVETIVERACKVHYVTERENQKVRPFMAQGMTHKEAYKAAGIQMLRNTQDLFSKRGRKTKQWKKEMVRKYG